MKVSVCGKGGSGKSTVVALLAAELQTRKYRVLVVDSDESNSGLYRMMGLPGPVQPLLELVGGKKNVQRAMRAQFSTGEDEPEMTVLSRPEVHTRDLPEEYIVEKNGRRLVAIGKIHQSLEGCACPMGVLNREFLKKLRLEPDEIALVDMEAGIEHFGRGVDTSIDTVVTVVEASLESVELAEKVQRLAVEAGANFAGAILNKLSSDELASNLSAELRARGISLLAMIPYHEQIAQANMAGAALDSAMPGTEVAAAVDALLEAVEWSEPAQI